MQATMLEQTEQGTRYRVEFSPGKRDGSARTRELIFTVTPEGALSVDNRQADAGLCAGKRSAALLAELMYQTAREQVPGALAGRSRKGLARELRVHRRAYVLGVKRSHAVIAELGGMAPGAPGYDDNASWFEHPFRSLPATLKALFTR